MSTHHGELIHRILLEVIEDLTIIGLVQQILTGLPELHLGLVLTRATDAAALADHTLDEILRELAELEKCQRNVALLATGCCTKLDTGRILVPPRITSITAFATPPDVAKLLPQMDDS